MKSVACFLFVLLYFQPVDLISDELGEDCSNGQFKPQDEADSQELKNFNDMLQEKTFNHKLGGLKNCPETECKIDPKGEAIWIARDNLYKKFSMFSDDHGEKTLDGCFCKSVEREELDRCTGETRSAMIGYLSSDFDKDLAKIIQENGCLLFSTSCSKSSK